MSVSTGCTTTEPHTNDGTFNAILAAMIPSIPEPPAFPHLEWQYENGRYSLSERDADALLDYGENRIPLFRYELEVYGTSVEAIRQALRKDAINLDNLSIQSDR